MDASDILGLPRDGQVAAPAPKIKPAMTKKPDGVSREVFALTAGMPCVVPTAATAYKERRKLGKAVQWRWKDFGNAARSDDYRFHHWAKKNDPDEYYFATFNKTIKIDKYTDQEYASYFESEKWTKEETDELFELCQRFNTRFILIADRLSTERSIQDVKARYYSIARKLLDARGLYNDDELVSTPLYRFQYDKDYDVRRKEQLNQLMRRTPADEAEEAVLVAELQAIDGTLKKDHKVRMRAKKQAEAPPPQPGMFEESVGRRENPKRQRVNERETRGATKNFNMKVKGTPAQKVSLEDTIDAKVQRKLHELGIDSWPLPVASVVIAQGKLIDDLTKLCELEHRLRSTAHTIGQGTGFTLST